MKVKDFLIGDIVKLSRERDSKKIIKILEDIEKRVNNKGKSNGKKV